VSAEPDLSGRVALVTGARRGFGMAIALGLAQAGAQLVLASRDAVGLERVAADLRAQASADVYAIAVDVASSRDIERLRTETERRFAPPSILINAAGMFGQLAPFSETDPDDWIRTLTVNTIGAYLTCRTFVPGMLAQGFGRIVNLSSASTLLPPQVLDSAYSTSKTALNRLTRHLAVEIEGTGVAATVIHPGSAKTDMWADIREQAAGLGVAGQAFGTWAQRVEDTGGDPPTKAAALVLKLVDPTRDGRNGEFCWIDDGLDPPTATW
jgi:NAD(P)-dependent dehydrogenase (short-subunit alcohol dehydrogenase family)